MKTKTKHFLMAALAATVMTSCSSDDDATVNGASDYAIILSSENKNPATRALKQNIQLTQFENNEKIDVFINEDIESNPTTTYEQPLIYTADGSGEMAVPENKQPFFPASGKGVNIWAVYPSGTATSATASVEFSIEDDQSNDGGYKASDLLYGTPESNPVVRTNNSVQLTFNHLLSKINIELRKGVGSPNLNGAKVRLKGVKPTTLFDAKTGTIDGVTGEPIDVLAMTIPDDAYIFRGSAIIVPQNIAGGASFIEVELAAGAKLTYKVPKEGVNIIGKSVYDYTITVNMTELFVTSNINDWNYGETVVGSAEAEEVVDVYIPEKMPDLIAVPIKAGTFGMGIPGSTSITIYHTVTLTRNFYMSQYEITNKQFAQFLNAIEINKDGKNSEGLPFMNDCKNSPLEAYRLGLTWRNNKWEPYSEDLENHPASFVSWHGAKAFAEWVGGDLPTEAEWEYACRAGTTTAFSFGDDNPDEYIWYKDNSMVGEYHTTHAVGTKKPNAWGLYDMYGNVEEWCLDKYNSNYTAADKDGARESVIDPYNIAENNADSRITRGGYFFTQYSYLGSGARLWGTGPGNANERHGFRVIFRDKPVN